VLLRFNLPFALTLDELPALFEQRIDLIPRGVICHAAPDYTLHIAQRGLHSGTIHTIDCIIEIVMRLADGLPRRARFARIYSCQQVTQTAFYHRDFIAQHEKLFVLCGSVVAFEETLRQILGIATMRGLWRGDTFRRCAAVHVT